MTRDEAKEILEDALDLLVEVGNGTTDKDLHDAASKLFTFKSEWLKGQDEIDALKAELAEYKENDYWGLPKKEKP